MIKKLESDKVVVFWESHKVPRSVVEPAYKAEGMEDLLPSVDHFSALKSTTQHIVDAYGIRAGGKVDYNGLAHDRDAVGVEARRLIKGDKKNDLPFLFSLGAVRDPVDENKVTIEVLECDHTLCPEVMQNRVAIETLATQHWLDQCQYITANDLTGAITAMIKKSHGFLLREGGILWYLPEDMTGPYERIADALAPHGVNMQALYWNPVVNEGLLKHVCTELERRSMAVFQGQVEQAMDMRQRGAKPRSNGQQTRLEQWIEAEAMIQHNKSLLGRVFVKVCKAAQAAKEAIGLEAVEIFR